MAKNLEIFAVSNEEAKRVNEKLQNACKRLVYPNQRIERVWQVNLDPIGQRKCPRRRVALLAVWNCLPSGFHTHKMNNESRFALLFGCVVAWS